MKQVLVLADDYMEDYEVVVPYQTLQVTGVGVNMVCPDKEAGDATRTAIHDSEGDQTYSEGPDHNFVLNASFQYLELEQYDGLFLMDGGAPEYPRLSPRVLDTIHYFVDLKKPTAAICHGVQILATARMPKGKQVTVYPTVHSEMLAVGGIFMEKEPHGAMICDNLVTSPTWSGNVEILRGFLKLLGVAALW